MLFTTAVFVCLFLPVVLAGFFFIARYSHSAAATWLFAASLFFYGYWMPEFSLLLLASICGNFLVGKRIVSASGSKAKFWLVMGVSTNIVLLAYFKYANFFVNNLNAVTGAHWDIPPASQ